MVHGKDSGGDAEVTKRQRAQLDPSTPADPSEGVSGFLDNIASDAAGALNRLPRAVEEIGSAVMGDVAQLEENIFEEASGGDADWQFDTWNKLAEPIITESIPKTVNVASGGQIDFWKEIAEGGSFFDAAKAQKQFQEETLSEFYRRPVSFSLEHLGNISLVGSGAGAVLGKTAARASASAGGAAARTGGIKGAKQAARAQRKADLQQSKAPTTSPRRARQEVLREIEQQGGRAGSLAKASRLSSRTIGRPYSAAARKAVGTKIPGLGGRYTDVDAETGEPTQPRGPLGSRGGKGGPTGGGATTAAAGSLADMTLTGGVGGAVVGTLASARRAGAQGQSLADLTKQVRTARSVPESEFSPTAQRIRSKATHRLMDSPMGQRFAQSRFSQKGRGVRRTMTRTKQAIAKHRANLNTRFDMGKATQRIARGIQQRYSQLADEGVDLPKRSREKKTSTQTQLENDPAQMGRVMDEIEQVNQRRRERGQDPIDIPGTRDLDWSLTRVAQAEAEKGLPEGSLQRLVTRKAQLDDLVEPLEEAQRLAKEAGEAKGMDADQVDRMLRQNMSSELAQPQGAVSWSQLDEGTQDVVNRAARTWRGWQREHEAQLIQEGELATEQGAVRMTQRRPTQSVVRNTETGELDFSTDPDAIKRGDQQAQDLTVDEVPQYLSDAHRRVQKLEQDPGSSPDQVQKARADLDKAEKRWEKEEPTNDIYEPLGPDEQPPTARVRPERETRKKLRRKQQLIDRKQKEVDRQEQLVRDRFAAHRADSLDRYNELHAEMRMREKEALNADPETAQGQQAWEQYARAYEQLNAFENELVLSGIGGRPQPLKDLAAEIEGKLTDILYYARNSQELAPDEQALARFNEAVGQLEQIQSLMPEVSPILGMIGRQGLSGVSPELRALHRAARANPRLADTPEYQQALAWASNRTSRAGNAQVQGTSRQQWAANRGQSSIRRGRQALGTEGGDWFQRQIDELADLARRYQDESRDFEQNLAQTQSQARAHLEDLAKKQQKLQAARTRMENFQADVNQRLETAPAHYRDALRFARDEAPELDRMLREDFEVPDHIVDDLNLTGLPTTLEELADAGVNVSYVSTKAADPEGPMGATGGFMSATAQGRFRRAHASGDIIAEDQPSVIIPKQQMELVSKKMRNDAVSFIHRKFGRTPRQVLEEAGYSQGKVDEILEEAQGKTTYDEAGNVVSQTKPQPHVLSQKMAEMGFARADDARLTKNLRRSDQDPPTDLWLPQGLSEVADDALKVGNFEKAMSTFYDPAMGFWKAGVLSLRPAWQVFNFIGLNVMPIIGGGAKASQLYRYLPMAARARMRWGRGEPTDVPGLSRSRSAELFDTSTSMGEYQRDISQLGLAGHNIRQAAGAGEQALPDDAARRSMGKFVREKSSRAGGRAKRVVEGSFRLNSFFDHVYRASVYLSQLEEGANPQQAVRAAKQTLGDYTTMSPVERQVIRRSFPFYAWTRHITQLTAKQLKPSNIDRFAMQAMFIEILGEPNEQEEMLPHYRRGDIQISEGGQDEDPSFLSMGGSNPFMDVARPFVSGGRPSLRGTASLMSPALQLGMSNMTGIRPLTMRPYSRPYDRLDPQGRPIPSAPSLGDQLINLSPQASLARSVYRRASGETLARYGNDQPVLAEGVEEPSLAEDFGRQMFGITSNQEDVEQRAERRQQRFQRQARRRAAYQEKLKQYRGEGSTSPLRDLPLIP